jgi:hypothetical protein
MRSARITGPARTLAYFGLATVIGAALLGGAYLLKESLAGVFVVAALAMAAVLAASFWWWRGVDEAVREAHKAAWFWGGLIAVAVATPMLLLIAAAPDAQVEAWALGDDPYSLITTGVLGCLTVQIVGYSVAWAAWWLKRR